LTDYGDIIPRIQALLHKRSRAEIEAALRALNRFYDAALLEIVRELPPSPDELVPIPSPAAYLKKRMDRINPRAIVGFPRGTWPELYACLALAIAGRAFMSGEIVSAPHPRPIKFDRPRVDPDPTTAATA